MRHKQPILLLAFLAGSLSLSSCKKDKGDNPEPVQSQPVVGPAGTDGNKLYASNTTPAISTGKAGDYYLNTSDGMLYGPRSNESWGASISILMPGQALQGTEHKIIIGKPGSAAPGSNVKYYLDTTNYTLWGTSTAIGLELKGTNVTLGRRSFVTSPFSSFTGPVFYTFPGVTEDMLSSGYVNAVWRREQLLVNPGFYRQYPLPYSFTFSRNNASYLATLYHFIVRGGQVGVTFVNTSPFDYSLEQTVDFRYHFRFLFLDRGALGVLAAKNPGLNVADPKQVDAAINF